MAKQLNVNLGFTADTSQAAAQIQNLQNQLTGLMNSTNGSMNFGAKVAGDVNKASKSIAELKMHLQNATNVNTGTLDFTKLNESINKSGMSLQQYGDKLRSLGPAGQQAFNALAQSVAQSEIPIRRSNAALTEMWTTLKNTARWQISSSILHGFMGAISSAVGYAKDLNRSLNDIRIVTGASVDQMAQFAEQANRSAKALSASTTEYTKASLIYYQQGLDDKAVKERTDVTIKMANVSGQTAETVSDQMTAVWNNFAKGGEDLERFADVMVRLGADTASSSDEIAQGLEKFAAIGDMVGLSFDNAAAALATVTATTRQSADVVGTAFKTIFARIQGLKLGETLEDGTTLNKYSEALATVGISIKEQNGELKNMDTILAEMGAKWQTLSKDQQVALAQTVAGVRQYNQLVALMDNFDFYEQNLDRAATADGSLQEQADIYAESWQAASARVKAATQGIYEDLLDDEAFIDVLNTIEKILTYVDNLIDGLGGLGGVLTTIGTLLTRAFSAQIAQSMTSMVNGIKMMTAAGREQAQQQKAQFMKDSADTMRNMSDGSNEGNMRATMMEDQLRLQTSMIENSERMSAEEQQINQMLLDRQRILSENAVAAAKELDAAKEAKSDATMGARTDIASARLNRDPNVSRDNRAKDLAQLNKDFTALQTKMKSTIKVRADFKELSKIPEEGRKSSEILNTIKEKAKELNNVRLNGVVSALKEADLEGENFEVTMAKLDATMERVNAPNILNMSDMGIRPETIEQLVGSMEREVAANEKVEQATNEANAARDRTQASINGATGAQKTWADQMVAGANVVMSLMSALQAVSGIIDVATNPDMSGWEKFLSIGSSLAMMFVMLAPLLTGTNLQFLATAAASVGAAVGMKAESVAALEATAATGALSASLWTLLWPIGLVMAAIAALVGIFALFNSIAKDNATASLEGQLEATEEASNNLAESLRKTQEEADNLKSAFDGYNSVVEELKQCEKGTDEWREALEKVNNEVIALLDKYPELAGYIDSSEKAGVYRDDKTGALAVNENFFKDKSQSLENGIENISIGKVLTNQRQAVLNQQNAEEELSSLLFDKLLVSAEDIRNGMVQDLIDSYMGKSDKTFADIFSNKHESILEGFFAILEDSSTGLSDAFQKVAQASNQVTLGLGTTGTTIANLALGNNQKIQNSEYAEQIIATSGKRYEDFYKEAIDEINAEAGGAGWGKEGVSKWTKTNETAEKYLQDYLEAMGEKIEDYELLDTYGDDDARRFKFKKKDAEDSEAETLGLQQMLDVVASERVKEKMEGFGVGLTHAVEQLDNFVSNTTDMSQIQKDTIGATKDFLLDQNFKNTGLIELNAIDDYIGQSYNGDIGAYLGATFGGDNGVLDDTEAQALGYDSAQIMIDAFKSGLDEVDLSNFSKTIQDIVDKGADVSTSIAQRYSEMVDINSTFGTVEGSTELEEGMSPYILTEAQGERQRFDRAVQGGLSEDPAKANEELTRMVELLEQAPAGFQNLSEAADKIESSSVAALNEELQEAIDNFRDYEGLNFTDIADGVIDEDEAKDLDINTKSLAKYIDMLKKTEDGAGKTEAELMELAEASLKTAKAFSTLKEDWADYRKNLQSGDIAKQADAIAKVGDAFKGVFGFDLSELDISDTFLTDPSNIQLVEDAINGVDGALEKLQGKLFNDIIFDAIGDDYVKAVTDELIAKGLMLEGQDFTAAFTADPTGFITALTQCENASKISASAVQAAVSAMGYSMTYETETAETTQTAQTDGGYSWETVPGTPFEYEYVKNTEPGEEPSKESITITPVGLRKVPNAPVDVSTTQLTGGSATNYEFGDGTSTNNNVSMADIKNVKITKKADTPTSGSVKSAAPLVGSNTSPAGSGSKPKGGGNKGGGKGDKPKKPTKAKTVDPTEEKKKDEEIERYKEITEVIDDLSRELDEMGKKKEDAWGPDKLSAMEDELGALNNLVEAQKTYIDQIGQMGKDGKALGGKLKADQDKLAELGLNAQFDEFGRLTNYDELMGGLVDTWNTTQKGLDTREQNYENSVANVANTEYAEGQEQQQWNAEDANEAEKESIDKAREQADKDYDERKQAIEQYIETLNLSETAKQQLDDYLRQIKQLNYEKLMYKVEFKVEVNDRELKILEHKAKLMENNFYKTSEMMAKLQEKTAFYADGEKGILDDIEKGVADLKAEFEAGKITQADYIEGLGKFQDMAIENVEALYEMNEAMREYYADVIDEGISKIQDLSSHFEHLTSKLQHYQNILSLMGHEQNYDLQNNLLSAQVENLKNQIAVSKETMGALEEQLANAKSSYEKANTEEDKEYWRERIVQINNALAEEEDAYLSYVEAVGEAANQILTNKIEKAFKEAEMASTNDLGFDAILADMDRLNTLTDEYLTNTNKMYETNKLIASAQTSIDKTQNTQAKKKYQDYIKYIEQLQVSGNLSKSELEVAQARYKVLEAEIALEEAKNTKSEVRLTRDSEGNFGYVYTANQDTVADATQNYLDAQNELYNIGLENTQNYREKSLQLQQQTLEDLKQLEIDFRVNHIISEEQYNQQKASLLETSNALLTSYQEQFNLAQFTMATTQYSTLMEADDLFYDGQLSKNKNNRDLMEIRDSEYYGGLESTAENTQETLQKNLDLFNLGVLDATDTQYEEMGEKDTLYYTTLQELCEDNRDIIDGIFNTDKDSLSEKIGGDFYDNLDDALSDCYDATEDWQIDTKDLVDAVGVAFDGSETGEEGLTQKIESTKQESQALKDFLVGKDGEKGFIQTINDEWNEVHNATEKWTAHWEELDKVIERYEDLIDLSQELTREQAKEKLEVPDDPVDPNANSGGTNSGGTNSGSTSAAEAQASTLASQAMEIVQKVHKGTIKQNSSGWKGNAKAAGYSDDAIALAHRAFNDSKEGGGWSYYYDKALQLVQGYDTGGYTGDWGPEGKLALLHQKELVLNAQDTENFLTATTILREISQMLDTNALIASLGAINLNAMTVNSPADQVLQQEVTIHADFPNVSDHTEIEMAIDNLINAASQYANRK